MDYQVVVLSSPHMSQYQCDDLRERMKSLAKLSPGALVHAPFVLGDLRGVHSWYLDAVRGLPLVLRPMKIAMYDVERVADLSSCSAEVWAYPRYSEAARRTNVTTIVQHLREREYRHIYVTPF